ncbi:MAG: matrixin family metalloprotease [Sandaracinaceae bacterium]|nr:matrixin family metalloprotease [Sandaracinaceae bacterium]
MSRLALSALLVLSLASPARAYRTSEDSLANQRAGITGRIAYEPLPVPYAIARPSSEVPEDALLAATRAAFETWVEPACSALRVEHRGRTTTPVRYGDGQNVLEWVESGWSARGFGSFTIGVTTNQLAGVGDRWTISESDMELNGEGYRWVIDGGEPDADPVDVQGLVVHEAGHFLGLLHTCERSAFDGAPACAPFDETPTMAPVYTGEEQRTLTADDIAGICYLYPAPPPPPIDAGVAPPDAGAPSDAGSVAPDAGSVASDAGAAPEDRGGCACRAVPSPAPRLPALLLLGLALVARSRRTNRG